MMPILKKNILSILCGVVVIIAIVAYFLPVSGLFAGEEGLEAKARQRKAKYDQLNSLITKSRSLPVVKLDATTPITLESFPVELIIKRGTELTEQLKGQSNQMLALAVQMNQRPPLLPDVFPNLNDQKKYRFRDAYQQRVNNDFRQLLHATNPPNEQDIAKAETDLWYSKYAQKIVIVNNLPANMPQIEAQYNQELEGLRAKLEREQAGKYKLYLEPNAITTNTEVMQTTQSPPTQQVWYAQTALWVQEDIIASIAALNGGTNSVIYAPVKHVVKLEVPEGLAQFIMKPQQAASAEDPAAAAAPATGPDYTFSPTGRICNPIYDVVKFTLVVKMDAAHVPRLVQELSRGRFMTVHEVDLSAVDASLARAEGYFYGTAPIVQVSLTGEALLLRDWTKKLVPDPVKKELPGFDVPGAVPTGEAVAVR